MNAGIAQRRRAIAPVLLAALLSACGQPDEAARPAADDRSSEPPPSAVEAPVEETLDSTNSLSPAPPAPPTMPVAGAATIPEALVGTWDASAAACAGPRGELRLVVEPRRLIFWESTAAVVSVRPGPDESSEIEAVVTGEGETERRRFRLRDAEDNSTLSVTIAGATTLRVNCYPPD